jgi:hypothetical protein
MRLVLLIGSILAASVSLAAAESKGQPTAPGQKQTQPGDAKTFAPGTLQTKPGEAKKFAPGQQDKTTPKKKKAD